MPSGGVPEAASKPSKISGEPTCLQAGDSARRPQRARPSGAWRWVGYRFHEAVWMLGLGIDQLRTELRWLKRVIREAPQRAGARKPDYPAEVNVHAPTLGVRNGRGAGS